MKDIDSYKTLLAEFVVLLIGRKKWGDGIVFQDSGLATAV